MSEKKVAVLFTGIGSQYVGMGKDLYDNYRVVQEFFEEAYNCQNLNFVKLCFASSDSDLNQIQNLYLSLFLINSSFYALLKEMGLEGDLFAGKDIGYFSAIYASGGISFPDGLYLLNKISGYYASFVDQNALKIVEIKNVEISFLEKAVTKFNRKKNPISISYFESDDSYIVSGYEDSMNKLLIYLDSKDIDYSDKKITMGMYSNFLGGLSEHVKLYLEKVDIKDPQFPVISPIDGSVLKTGDQIRFDLVEHLSNPYDMNNIIMNLKNYHAIIEIGPKSQMLDHLKDLYPDQMHIPFRGIKDIDVVKEFLGSKAKDVDRVSE